MTVRVISELYYDSNFGFFPASKDRKFQQRLFVTDLFFPRTICVVMLIIISHLIPLALLYWIE